MPMIDEGEGKFWHYRIVDPSKFEKFHVKEVAQGVKITFGKVKGSNRWEVQNYMFNKELFKTKEQVRKWLDKHLKGEIQTLLDFKSWNEYRRRAVNAFLQISKVE